MLKLVALEWIRVVQLTVSVENILFQTYRGDRENRAEKSSEKLDYSKEIIIMIFN